MKVWVNISAREVWLRLPNAADAATRYGSESRFEEFTLVDTYNLRDAVSKTRNAFTKRPKRPTLPTPSRTTLAKKTRVGPLPCGTRARSAARAGSNAATPTPTPTS